MCFIFSLCFIIKRSLPYPKKYPVNSPIAAPKPAAKPTRKGFNTAPRVNIKANPGTGKIIDAELIRLTAKTPRYPNEVISRVKKSKTIIYLTSNRIIK